MDRGDRAERDGVPVLPAPREPAAAIRSEVAVPVTVGGLSGGVRRNGRGSGTSRLNGSGDTPWGRAHWLAAGGWPEPEAPGPGRADQPGDEEPGWVATSNVDGAGAAIVQPSDAAADAAPDVAPTTTATDPPVTEADAAPRVEPATDSGSTSDDAEQGRPVEPATRRPDAAPFVLGAVLGAAQPVPPEIDLALLGRLGLLDPDAEPDPVLTSFDLDTVPASEPDGPAQQIQFRVTRRDGSPLPGAGVSLLDNRGQDITTGYADAQGCGCLRAPHPGTYLIVSAAPDHQPGAATVAIRDSAVQATLHMPRSVVLTGAVRDRHGPVVAARVTLVQDGQVVDSTRSDTAGAYRLADLATGAYGMSVAAPGCTPLAVRIDLADGSELHQDIDLRDIDLRDIDLRDIELRDAERAPGAGTIPEQASGRPRMAGWH